MRNGDISNKALPSILVKANDCLIKRESRSVMGIPLKPRFSFNRDVEQLLHHIMQSTDYRIVLVFDVDCSNDYVVFLSEHMNEVPFAYYRFYDPIDIKIYLDSGVYLCYIDNDINKLNMVGHKDTYTVSQFKNLL